MGMFSENGNFQWFDGMIKPVKNEWAWSKLTNMVCKFKFIPFLAADPREYNFGAHTT